MSEFEHLHNGLPTTCEMAERRLVDARKMIDSLGTQLSALRKQYQAQVAEARTAANNLANGFVDVQDELTQLREHSTMANEAGWKLAEALGYVERGAQTITANLVDLAAQMIAERDKLRRERDRLLMKAEPDRIIPPLRLDELEQFGSGALP